MIKLDPDAYYGFLYLGYEDEKINDYRDAIDNYKKAIKFANNNEGYIALIRASLLIKDFKTALNANKIALKITLKNQKTLSN